MSTITPSRRLARVKRVFDPYQDRRDLVRLDRNEDPAGWDAEHFEQLRNSLTAYDLAAYADSTEFQNALAAWLNVSPDMLLVTAGSDAAIKCVFETYVDPGERVLMQDPCWRMYEVYNNVYQGEAVVVPYDRSLVFDIGAVRRALREQNLRVVILANPNQPTGTLIAHSDIEAVIADADKAGTLVVMDEAYHLFSPETAVPLIARHANLIVVRTFSKAFGLAGLRLGYCVGHPERIRELSLLRPVTDSNSIALKFGEFALRHMDFIDARVADFIAAREFLSGELQSAGLDAFRSHTNFLLVRCPSLEAARQIVVQARARRYLLKGPFTAPPLDNCVRISIGPLALMRRFWADCKDILLQHAQQRG